MKFSIIIPVYNLSAYVRECLDSVVAQTFAGWECICVDDGSTDSSPSIIDEYAKADSRFRAVHKKNGGEGSARNAGLDLATGEWICYLDGDDVWHRCFLDDVKSAIESDSRVDMVSVLQQNFKDGEDCAWTNERIGKIKFFDNRSSLSSRLLMIGVWSTAYKREIYGDLRFTDHCLGADRVYTMRCLSRSCFAALVENRDYGYRVRQNSMAHNEWTPRKILSAISFSKECVSEIARCGKQVESSVSRGLCSIWLERNPVLIAGVKDFHVRRELRLQWLNGIEVVTDRRFFSIWYRFVCTALVATKRRYWISRMCELVLCVFPYKLKTKGFHRR